MRFQHEVTTEGACFYALFDPWAVPELGGADFGAESVDACLLAARNGRLFFFQESGDGSAVTHVFIDEQPDTELQRMQRGRVDRACLVVPSGWLVLTGGEWVPAAVDYAKRAAEGAVWHEPEAAAWKIAPGTYSLSAFTTDPEVKAARIKIALGNRHARLLALQGFLLAAFSCLGLTSLAAAVCALTYLVMRGSNTASSIAIASGVSLVLCICIGLGIVKAPPFARAEGARELLRQAFPDLAVVLTKLDVAGVPVDFGAALLHYDDGREVE